MYIKINNGPRMKTRGTSVLTLVHDEDWPFNTTLCFLFVKKCSKTFNKLPDIPFPFNLNICLF